MTFETALAGRDNNFNLIRMLAATGVLVSHAWPLSLGPQAVQPLQGVLGLSLGTLCVQVFFAISGYFITQSFDRRASVAGFLRARALRLFPALLGVLLVSVLAGALLTTATMADYGPDALGYVWRNLGLFRPQYPLAGVFADNPNGDAVNGSLWTLQYEVRCYLAVLLLGVTRLLRAPVLAALVLLLAVMASGGAGGGVRSEDPPCHRAWPALCTWRAVLSEPASPAAAVVAGGGAGAGGRAGAGQRAVAGRPDIGAGLWGLLAGRAAVGLVDAHYNRLGDYSYGLYLYAFPVQQLVASLGCDTTRCWRWRWPFLPRWCWRCCRGT